MLHFLGDKVELSTLCLIQFNASFFCPSSDIINIISDICGMFVAVSKLLPVANNAVLSANV